MTGTVTEVSSAAPRELLSTLLAQRQVLRFSETGCMVGASRQGTGYVGVSPNDQVDLLIDNATDAQAAAAIIQCWAQYWSEEQAVSLR